MAATNPEPAQVPERSSSALWGTAHLACGIAIFAAVVYVAWGPPVDVSPRLNRLSLALFAVGLAWVTFAGWRHVERGWRLRRPPCPALWPPLAESASDAVAALVMAWPLLRAETSRLLTSGLDRLAATVVTIGVLSLLLTVAQCWGYRRTASITDVDAEDWGVLAIRWLLTLTLCTLVIAIEWSD